MPTPAARRMRGPKPDRRRALELLASCRDGCAEAVMVAHGFSMELLVEARPRVGLLVEPASVSTPAGARPRSREYRITEAGRQAIAEEARQ